MEFVRNNNLLVGLVVGSAILFTFIYSIKLRRNAFAKVECWFCGFRFGVLARNANQFYCPKCEQYNGFSSDGSYNKEINEMYFEGLNKASNTYTYPNHTPNNTPNICNICAHNQQLMVLELAKWDGSDEKEAEDYEKQIHSKYRLCPHCKLLVEEHLKSVRKVVIARTIGGKSTSIPHIPIISNHTTQLVSPIMAVLCRTMIHLLSFCLLVNPVFKVFEHTPPVYLLWIQYNWVLFSLLVVLFKQLLSIFDKSSKNGTLSLTLLVFASFLEIAVYFPEIPYVSYFIVYKSILLSVVYSLIILYEIPPYTFSQQFRIITNRSLHYTPSHSNSNIHKNQENDSLENHENASQNHSPQHLYPNINNIRLSPTSNSTNHTNHATHTNSFFSNNHSSPIQSSHLNHNNNNHSPFKSPLTPSKSLFSQTQTHSPTKHATHSPTKHATRLSNGVSNKEDSLGFESLIASMKIDHDTNTPQKTQTPWWKKWLNFNAQKVKK
eukprot:TRINITY_DN2693_c0_g1_i1.p1 TRINITY_DN2693_c0_g1~~TRINITY_DN2693_c0_g1_i1.p1  ORF type:complete len:493 (+),score=99.89 TRINITY_DN2693_c0_g1_i1:234-1712(+)